MTGQHRTPAGTDEGPDQTIQSGAAAAADTGFAGHRYAGFARCIAGRKDDDIGIQLEIENFIERQKAVGSGIAKGGHQCRLRRAGRTGCGDQAMRRKVQNPIIVDIILCQDAGICERRPGYQLGISGADERPCFAQFAIGDREVPLAERPLAIGILILNFTADARDLGACHDWLIVAESQILLRSMGLGRLTGIGECARRHRGADIQVPTEPFDTGKIKGIAVRRFGPGQIAFDRRIIRDEQVDRQAKHCSIRFEYQMLLAGKQTGHRFEKIGIEAARRFDVERIGQILSIFEDRN